MLGISPTAKSSVNFDVLNPNSYNYLTPILVSIVGPTAIGKTSLAVALARKFNTEIVSADSRQCYKEMSIGTAKPTLEEQGSITHHFIDSHSITAGFSAGEFGREAVKRIHSLHKMNPLVIAVGGSTLYLKALWEGFDEMPDILPGVREQLNEELEKYGLDALLTELQQCDPDYFDEVDKHNHQRVIRALEVVRSSGRPFSTFRNNLNKELPYLNLKIGLNMEREMLFERINRRMDMMVEHGLFEEAEMLLPYKDYNALQTVGYSEVFGFLEGRYDKAEAVRLLKRNSRRYAKRQMTWFKRYDDIQWFEPSEGPRIEQVIERSLSHK